jgi:hypothetical protein
MTTNANIRGDTVIISEVEYDPSGSEPGSEWFELYNPTENSIDISGWEITDGEGRFTFPALSHIPSGAYFIAAHTTGTFNLSYPGVIVDFEYGPIDVGSVSLANGGDDLTLSSGATSIDFISWENHTPTWISTAHNGESITRSTSIDTDTPTDWLDNQIPTPKSGTYSSISGPAVVPNKSRKGGTIRYLCKNTKATNYTNTKFGRHRESYCEYDKINDDPLLIVNDLCKNFLDTYAITRRSIYIKILQSCLNIFEYNTGIVDGIYEPNTHRAMEKYKNTP